MASTPRERDAAMLSNGLKLMVIGVALCIPGFVLALLLDGTAAGIGVAVIVLGSLPLVAGLGLWLSGFVSRRRRAGKPFA